VITSTVTVQVPGTAGGPTVAIGMVPPVRRIVLVPATAVSVPPQVLLALAGFAIIKLVGKVSVSVAMVAALLVSGLDSVMVRVDV